jgi:hypothetical protein
MKTIQDHPAKGHPTRSYKLVNNVSGWVAFLVASVTYVLTVEPTASLWDCGEFISTSVGLQVGHPPGAPLFMIISRLFAMFAPTPETQALMINIMSALASAFTTLFLFWTITALAKKLLLEKGEACATGKLIAIMGAGMVGALTYTFADTPWFSAVEGEVYALSSLLTAVVFWAILKWEEVADEPYANRWIVFIAYMIGLSPGVHLLNLLVIPSIVFTYYFKKYNPTRKGVILSAILSVLLLGVTLLLTTQWIFVVAGWFELAFVNGFGLPFNTGVVICALLLVGGLAYGIHYTLKRKRTLLNTILTCFTVMLIGFSSYAMVVIRSVSNPPIDENSPDNVFALLSYIQREQYGTAPLFRGPYYNAPVVDSKEAAPVYMQNEKTGKYEVVSHGIKHEYDRRFVTLFPRMHSSRPDHPQGYLQWAGEPRGPVYSVEGRQVQVPSFWNNLKFLFNYQIGHMYVRYFMWNFSGKQNDIQGNGDFRYGNWITGIPPVDELLVGPQQGLPDRLKNERSRNKYYMLPFLLGLVGLAFQYKQGKKGKQSFWVVMLLFFFTGVAIVLYLNQPPYEPRERDYAYAGSFYAYAIWVGLGVISLWQWLQKKMPSRYAALAVGAVCLVAVPVNMAAENWDDHDRSGRYATIAHAKNYLNSCAPNAILFTFGDNDTFPLWYAQEVEGVRRDVRVVNLSLLSGDWYVDQMKRRAYEGAPVPISFTKDQYHTGKRDVIYVQERFDKAFSLKDVMAYVGSDRPETKLATNYGVAVDYIPTTKVYVPVDSAKVVDNGTVSPEDAGKIVNRLEVTLPKRTLYRNDLMVLDIIATNNWERPIYFGIGMGTDNFLGFNKYFQLEGAAFRLVPIETQDSSGYGETGRINSRVLYDNLMNKFTWGNIKDPAVNIDHFHSNTISVMRYRGTFARLAETLLDEAGAGFGDSLIQLHVDTARVNAAVRVLDKSLEELPLYQVPADFFTVMHVASYYRAGEVEKANRLTKTIVKEHLQDLKYYWSLPPRLQMQVRRDENASKLFISTLLDEAARAGQRSLLDEIDKMWEETVRPAVPRATDALPPDSSWGEVPESEKTE